MPRGDTCGWPFFFIYDFNRSPWRRLSTSRRPGRPLQSPIDIIVAIHGCNKVSKARAILCPCLLPRGPWCACAEPFPNPGCSWASSHQKSSSSVGSSAAASSAVARPATVLKKGTPVAFLAGRRADRQSGQRGGPPAGGGGAIRVPNFKKLSHLSVTDWCESLLKI